MIFFENTDVYGFVNAARGMRNPMNSWSKGDSELVECAYCCHSDECPFYSVCEQRGEGFFELVGKEDLKLMNKLATAGTDHSKFLRMINVTVDITAPLYWWKEFDTYKVGTVRNSCSTMHKIHAKEFELYDFSDEHLFCDARETLLETISTLNCFREIYLNWDKSDEYDKENFTKKEVWWQMIQLLPSSYNQKATVQLNYQVLRSIYHSERKQHKLDEWRIGFMEWIESLPYAELITSKSKGVKES